MSIRDRRCPTNPEEHCTKGCFVSEGIYVSQYQDYNEFSIPFPKSSCQSEFSLCLCPADSLHWSGRHGDAAGTFVLGDVCLTDLGALLGLLKVLLSFPVLGQVDGGDLLGLFNLLLVRLDLLLELVNQVSDAVLVLLVLLLLEQQLLDAPLALGDGLVNLVSLLDCAVQLKLNIPGAGLKLGWDLGSTAGHGKGCLLSLLLDL